MLGGACLLPIMARCGLKVIIGPLDTSFNFFAYIYHSLKNIYRLLKLPAIL